MPGFLVYHQLPELAQTHVHRVHDAIQPFHPLPSIFASVRFFSNESVLHIRWPKYWSFSFTVLPMDWFDLLAVQGTLILQQHSSKASILAVEIHKSQPSQSPFPHAPHPSPLGCHRAPVAHFLLPTADSHWLSMLCMVMYMFPYYSPKSSHLLLPHCDCKSVFCICVTSAAPQTGSSVPYF